MDDAHTRPRHLDLVFGWINHSTAPEKRPRVVLLSSDASGQNPNLVALNAPPSINLQKPKFPIKIVNKHCGYTTAAITDAVVRLASQVVASSERFAGDILCFLPSKDEVRRKILSVGVKSQEDTERRCQIILHSPPH
jgi:HrpA-like RNA helicase